MKVFFFIIYLILQSSAIYSRDNSINSSFQNKSVLRFIENKGQITDQNYHSQIDIDAKLAMGKGLNIFIGKHGLHYQYSKIIDSINTEMYRMDVQLLNCNPNAKLIKDEEQNYYETYYTPPFSPNHGAKANSFKRITYQNIYPNIDWTIYIKENKLEYDFIVHPGGNVKDIQMMYGGAKDLALQQDGSIKAINPMGKLVELAPISYLRESGESKCVNYCLINDKLSFNAPEYSGTLVIDPTLVWATYFGGNTSMGSGSNGLGLSIDDSNNVFMCGVTPSNENIMTSGAFEYNYQGGAEDAIITKFTSTGSLVWATFFGGTGTDAAQGIINDKNGNLYVCGITSSDSNIATNGSFQSSIGNSTNGMYDAFIAKFNNNGNINWSTYYGGPMNDNLCSATIDSNGDLYFIGITNSNQNIASTGCFQNSFGGFTDIFLVKFSSSGARIWCTYYGGAGYEGYNYIDFGHSNFANIAYDTKGYIYIASNTNSNNNISSIVSYQNANNGMYDAFIAKFSLGGNRIWSTYFGGTGNDRSNGIALDKNSNIYITGPTSSNNNYLATAGCFQATNPDLSSYFLSKFNSSGNLLWSTYYGNNVDNVGFTSVSCDSKLNVYLVGTTDDTSLTSTPNAYQGNYINSQDAFIAEFSKNGVRKYATYYKNETVTTQSTIDNIGNLFFTGGTNCLSFGTPGSYQDTLNPYWNTFISKWLVDTLVFIPSNFTDSLFCARDTFSLPFTVNDTFGLNNTFMVQLSDSSGSFVNATIIGLDTTSLAGSVLCTIPAFMPGGIHYRLRILSTNPIDTSKDNGFNIQIKRISNPVFTGTQAVCLNDTLKCSLSDSSNGVSYNWVGPNGFSSFNTINTRFPAVFADSGYYVASVNLANCHIIDSIFITVKPLPDQPIALSTSPVCASDTLFLYAIDSTNNVNYKWTGPNSFASTQQNPSRSNFVYLDSGNYYVKAVLNGCNSIPDTVHVEEQIGLIPNINITSSQPVVMSGKTDTFTASVTNCTHPIYQWYVNNIKITGATGPTFSTTLTAGQQVRVELHCSGACYNPDSAVSNIFTATDVVEQYRVSTIHVYPNPTENELIIEGVDSSTEIKLVDVSGKILFKLISTKNLEKIITTNFVNGFYFLQLNNDRLNRTWKIYKK